MALDSPRPLVPFKPPEPFSTKIDFKLTPPLDAYCRKHVVVPPREVYTCKGGGKALAVVGEEEGAGGEGVAAADGVAWGDAGRRIIEVVPTAFGVFKKFAKIVEMQACA